MQPVLMITSAVEGIVYINGAFVGEVRPDAPLFRPIGAYGSVYVEHRPLKRGYLPMAALIAFSAGRPVTASFEASDGVRGIIWPFDVTEAELSPRKIVETPPETKQSSGAGLTFRYTSFGDARYIEIETPTGAREFPLPDSANPPALAKQDDKLFISGDTQTGERYLLALNESASEELLRITANEIEFLGSGKIRATEDIGGTLGRSRSTVFAYSNGEYIAETSEISSNGEARFLTPVDCALAAIECFQLGDESTLSDLFAPDNEMPPETKAALADTTAAVKLRFTPPNGRSAVGALKLINPSLAEAVCVYYRAEMLSGAWRLVELAL